MLKNIFAGIFANSIMSKSNIMDLLKNAVDNKVITSDGMFLVESALRLSDLKVKDIMLPRHKMDVLDINYSIKQIVDKVVETGHSRFPVIDGEISNMMGIFHNKDLVKFFYEPNKFNLREHLREIYFVPEIKKLDSLMYEMRLQHLHLAIVVDEFTNIVGFVTLEMIIEQIIGEIEDEYDLISGDQEFIDLSSNYYRVKGFCKLKTLNSKLGMDLHDKMIETISGFLIKILGRVPVGGEILKFQKLEIEIINSDSRKINILTIKKLT